MANNTVERSVNKFSSEEIVAKTKANNLNDEKGYIFQRASKIVAVFIEHLAANCEHCELMYKEIYKNAE